MRTSALFVAKTNIEYLKIYSVSTSDMDRKEEKEEGFIYLLQTRSPYKNTKTDAKKIVIVPQKYKQKNIWAI